MNRAVVFAVAVFLLAYRRFVGEATVGELITVGGGPLGELPPPDQLTTDTELSNPSGLTHQEELDALNRYRPPVGVVSLPAAEVYF